MCKVLLARRSKKPTRVAAPSPRASLRRRTVCGRTEQRRPPGSKHYETKVRMVWGSFLIAAAALKTPTRNGNNAQGGNLTFCRGYGVTTRVVFYAPSGQLAVFPFVLYREWRDGLGVNPSVGHSLPSPKPAPLRDTVVCCPLVWCWCWDVAFIWPVYAVCGFVRGLKID